MVPEGSSEFKLLAAVLCLLVRWLVGAGRRCLLQIGASECDGVVRAGW